ncbi:hypothetical protein JTE90_011979 [Oedothorax gibbosus]|uniref:Uncharacterized protein n=1 Tax=Oedothorax gibbosus TaxID=931172 RepID=A0AAV6TG22_9ARAC|nr:hypothetical protein JTE90_011979 [Oedothorax gibbosus]
MGSVGPKGSEKSVPGNETSAQKANTCSVFFLAGPQPKGGKGFLKFPKPRAKKGKGPLGPSAVNATELGDVEEDPGKSYLFFVSETAAKGKDLEKISGERRNPGELALGRVWERDMRGVDKWGGLGNPQ